MKTIAEHLDDLDRMIDAGNTPVANLRSQIAFIQREVTALEENYAALAGAHAQLQQTHTQLQNSQPSPTIDIKPNPLTEPPENFL